MCQPSWKRDDGVTAMTGVLAAVQMAGTRVLAVAQAVVAAELCWGGSGDQDFLPFLLLLLKNP